MVSGMGFPFIVLLLSELVVRPELFLPDHSLSLSRPVGSETFASVLQIGSEGIWLGNGLGEPWWVLSERVAGTN
jgi:hypothetical protein